MKNLTLIILGVISLNPSFLFAADHSSTKRERAITVEIGSTGGAMDSASLHNVRDVIGSAFTKEVADTIYVYSPRIEGPIFREGGLSICVEAGFSSTSEQFNDLFKQLNSIQPSTGTFYNVKLVKKCEPIGATQPLACGGLAGTKCPKNKICIDDLTDDCDPTKGGRDCSGICRDK